MRKVSREMPAEWVLEVMRKAPYITVSFIRRTSAYGLPLPLSLASAEDGRVWYFLWLIPLILQQAELNFGAVKV